MVEQVGKAAGAGTSPPERADPEVVEKASRLVPIGSNSRWPEHGAFPICSAAFRADSIRFLGWWDGVDSMDHCSTF